MKHLKLFENLNNDLLKDFFDIQKEFNKKEIKLYNYIKKYLFQYNIDDIKDNMFYDECNITKLRYYENYGIEIEYTDATHSDYYIEIELKNDNYKGLIDFIEEQEKLNKANKYNI